jgi:alpha-N-arabinofuranosidase
MTDYEVKLGEPAGTVSRRLFGMNLEVSQKILYGGVWDKERNIARSDVKAAVGALGVTVVRWPGSSSACDYRWRDGVGPVEKRPLHETTWWTEFGGQLADFAGMVGEDRQEMARRMGPPEPNQFGTDEFLHYCLDLGIDPMMIVNIGGGDPPGTGTPEDAAAWVRYCNVDRVAPRPVGHWQLGNEVWGTYEYGHCTPEEYGERLIALSTAMRAEDPTIKLYGVGGALQRDDFSTDMAAVVPELDRWTRDTFAIAGDAVDGVTATWFSPGMIGRDLRDNAADTLQVMSGGDAFGEAMDRMMRDLDAAGGAAAALPLYMTEWGQQVLFPDHYFNDNHRVCDGLYFAGCFNRFLERADRVRGANLCMIVNALSPIQVVDDRLFVTAAYHVMRLYRQACRRLAVPVEITTDHVDVPPMADLEQAGMVVTPLRRARTAAVLDATATADSGGVTVFLTNRDLERPLRVTVRHGAGDGDAVLRTIEGDGPWSRNTVDDPDRVHVAERRVAVKDGASVVELPPCTTGALLAGAVEGGLVDG